MKKIISACLLSILLTSLSVSAQDFKVADYGAVGDGETDDGPAIRRAIAAAVKASPGSRVLFEKKNYYLDKSDGSYQMQVSKVDGLEIIGNGAQLINNLYNGIIEIIDSKNIVFKGFTIDSDPLPFSQGTVLAVNEKEGSFLWQIQQGYANPVKLAKVKGKKKVHSKWGVLMDPKHRIRKPGAAMHWFVEKMTIHNEAKDIVKVQITAQSIKNLQQIKAGDRYVHGISFSHGGNIIVKRSSDILLMDNTIYTMKYGMTHSLADNHGRIHVKNVNITFKPESDRLITTLKDGYHVKHNAIGPIIEDSIMQGMLDDSINISVTPYWIKKALGNNKYQVAHFQYAPRVGDELMAYTPKSGEVIHGFKVLKVEQQSVPKNAKGLFNIITLNKAIANVELQKGPNLFPGGTEKMQYTGLYNISRSGKDYIIRNNYFGPQRRYGVLARTKGGLIEGNTFDFNSSGGSGIALHNEVGSFYEGPFPSDITVRNNIFKNTAWASLKIGSRGNGTRAKNITIENNIIEGGCEDPLGSRACFPIVLKNISGGIIKGNKIITGTGTDTDTSKADISSVIQVQNSKDISYEKNIIKR